MVVKWLRSERGFMSLIGMVLAMAIIAFLFLTYLRPQNKQERLKAIDQATGGTAKEAGIDTSSQLSVLQSSKIKIKAIEDYNKQRGDELMKEIEAMYQY